MSHLFKIGSTLLVVALAFAIFAPAAQAARPGPSIVEIALSNPEFSTLVAAVVKADLVDQLSSNRQFTVFAPTNAAFDAAAVALIGPGANGMDLVDALDEDTLRSVLYYHISPGERDASSVIDSDRIRTLSKGFLFPMVSNGMVYIVDTSAVTVDAQVIIPNVFARNGVVHVIDQVLLP
jgi:uncharacterized surface protein with fasciclin (FAS1) repeats